MNALDQGSVQYIAEIKARFHINLCANSIEFRAKNDVASALIVRFAPSSFAIANDDGANLTHAPHRIVAL
jgi:hypothetical protein